MTRMSPYANCTAVSPECPVAATTYGYYPALGVNAALLAIFAILCLSQIVLGLTTRVYAYSITVAAGCFVEALGYGGRLMQRKNPWSQTGLRTQIVCLIIAPSFLAGGIYFTLKHVIRFYGPQYSRLRPNLYTWIFISCDIASILIQAAGGSVAAGAGKTNAKMLSAGDAIIIAGIAFQVATMAVCGVLAGDFILRYRRLGRDLSNEEKGRRREDVTKARLFCAAVAFAYLTVLIRCVYRLPEMAGGWGNPRMRNEAEFLGLDGLMIALAATSLTVVHPGIFFQGMRTRKPGAQ